MTASGEPLAEVIPLPPRNISSTNAEELNSRLLHSLIGYIEKQYGRDAFERVARATELSVDDLVGKRYWISWRQFEDFLANARTLMQDDEEFRRACKYRLVESYGPLRFLVRAARVVHMYLLAARTMHLVSRISRYDVLESSRRHLVYRYTTTRAESRLMCLSRLSAIEAFPTLWGLPSAQVVEKGCISQGDSHCEYHIRWHEQIRWLPSLAGAGLGAALAGLGTMVGWFALPPLAVLPVFGAGIGYVLELWRTNQANYAYGEETNRGLRELARQNAEAMQEVWALHERQRDWSRALEEQVTERTQALQEVIDRVHSLGQRRDITLRSFSHDLRNPLTVLKAATAEVAMSVSTPVAREALGDIDLAVREMDRLVRDLMEFVTSTTRPDLVRLTATKLAVEPLADRLRRRLRALVLGKDIRVTVFTTREAPTTIETDTLLFDRVLDNLLTNAAKFTDDGSIVVELAGTPGMLTVKVSDTGIGISADRIDLVLQAKGGSRSQGNSGYGLGLSIVVRLLDQIGGRLEVMSRPDLGSTFWAHFPINLPEAARRTMADAEDSIEEIFGRVVTIRQVVSGN